MPFPFNPQNKISSSSFKFYDSVTMRMMHESKSVAKTGRNLLITTSASDIWSGTGDVVLLSAAETLDIVSTSAADTSAGTGARTLFIGGLDINGLEISESITLNGTSAVTTSAAFFRINESVVLTVGTGVVNAGEITITGSSSGTEVAHLEVGFNRAMQIHYTVPARSYLLIRWLVASSTKGSNVNIVMYEQLPGRARIPLLDVAVVAEAIEMNIAVGAFFSPGNTVFGRAATTQGTGEASITFTGYLMSKEFFGPTT